MSRRAERIGILLDRLEAAEQDPFALVRESLSDAVRALDAMEEEIPRGAPADAVRAWRASTEALIRAGRALEQHRILLLGISQEIAMTANADEPIGPFHRRGGRG